ncbi:MAG: hypothetical protein PHS81_04405, partial [Candidatus Nanoarchaeia archaeon]|nr:hypothetical protein [Candidatus Nanoarchaeia archaeon]
MHLRLLLSVSVFLLLLLPAFSDSCTASEAYCSRYAEIEYNCRVQSTSSYSCTKYGTYQAYIPKTCTQYQQYNCDTRTVYDTCYGTCHDVCYSRYNVVYKKCWHFR